MRTLVAARLRKQDSDIVEAIQGIKEATVSEMVRQGLRMVLNNTNQYPIKELPNIKQTPENKKLPHKVATWSFPK